MKPTEESLKKQGFEQIGTGSPGFVTYGREDIRILYNKKADKVEFRYSLNQDDLVNALCISDSVVKQHETLEHKCEGVCSTAKKEPSLYQKAHEEVKEESEVYMNLVRCLIDVLSEYEVRHTQFPNGYVDDLFKGKQNHSSITIHGIKQIIIDRDQLPEKRKYSALREIVSAAHHLQADINHIKDIDKIIDAETKYLMSRLYK